LRGSTLLVPAAQAPGAIRPHARSGDQGARSDAGADAITITITIAITAGAALVVRSRR
jgi:hypothetical protein